MARFATEPGDDRGRGAEQPVAVLDCDEEPDVDDDGGRDSYARASHSASAPKYQFAVSNTRKAGK